MVDSVFLLRHGIRLNHDDPKYFRYYLKRAGDVPLSSRGIAQARETGAYLREKKINHLFCSPFFRTLQTAHEIAEELDLKIKVEHGFIELLNPQWFKEYPVLLTKEERKEIFPRVDDNYESFVYPTFPEQQGGEKLDKRVKETINKVLKNYEGTLLVVGHGASVKSAAKALSPHSVENLNVKMCALNKFVRGNGGWNHEYGTTKHLSEETFA